MSSPAPSVPQPPALADVPPLFSPEFQRNPYPTYAAHRAGPRLQPLAARPNFYMMFGYEDCTALWRDPRLSAQRPGHALVGTTGEALEEFDPFIRHMQSWLLLLDAPRHSLLRKLLNPAFSPSRIARLRDQITVIVERALDVIENSADADLIRDLAYPLPVQVVSEWLGLPAELHARCTELTNDIAAWLANIVRSPEQARVAHRAIVEMESYFAPLIRERRARPQDDLTSLLIDIAAGGERLSDAELLAQCIMMLFAGHETTRHLIGNGMYNLMQHPQAMRDMRENPQLVPNAVEELLRYEGPIQALSRGVATPLEFDGQTLPVGTTLAFMVGSAQRDSRQYPLADELDIRRRHIRHLAFGGDAHTCLGATLARLESQVAIGLMLSRFPKMACADTAPDWGLNFAIRGLNTLRVTT